MALYLDRPGHDQLAFHLGVVAQQVEPCQRSLWSRWRLAWVWRGQFWWAVAVVHGAVGHGYGTAAIGKSSTTVFGATMTDICRPVDEAKTIAPGLGINRLVG
jgi:hypothetical protein